VSSQAHLGVTGQPVVRRHRQLQISGAVEKFGDQPFLAVLSKVEPDTGMQLAKAADHLRHSDMASLRSAFAGLDPAARSRPDRLPNNHPLYRRRRGWELST
jgi:hypothetical protein